MFQQQLSHYSSSQIMPDSYRFFFLSTKYKAITAAKAFMALDYAMRQ